MFFPGKLFGRLILAAFAFCVALAGAAAGQDEPVLSFEVIDSRYVTGLFTVVEGEEVLVDWGDGTEDRFSDGRPEYSKDYGEAVNKEVAVYASDEFVVTEFRMDRRRANISLDLSGLPEGLERLRVFGNNTIRGNLSGLPRGMTRFWVDGMNTVKGSLEDLPEGMTHFDCAGDNTIGGDIAALPESLRRFTCDGNNSIEGNLAGLEALTRLQRISIGGENTIGGDLSNLPDSLERLNIGGRNEINGNVLDLPDGLEEFFLYGNNTVEGKLADLPDGLTRFYCYGNNRVAGNVEDLPESLVRLYFSVNKGIEGDMVEFPPALVRVDIDGKGTDLSYTGGRAWAENMEFFRFMPEAGYGLDTGEVDNLLKDFSETSWTGARNIWIAGHNAPRSEASDGAVESLRGDGVSIEVNKGAPADSGAGESIMIELN